MRGPPWSFAELLATADRAESARARSLASAAREAAARLKLRGLQRGRSGCSPPSDIEDGA